MQLSFVFTRDRALPILVMALFVLFVVMLPRYTDTEKTWFSLLIVTALGYIGCLAEDHFETKPATMFVTVMLVLLLARISPERFESTSGSGP